MNLTEPLSLSPPTPPLSVQIRPVASDHENGESGLETDSIDSPTSTQGERYSRTPRPGSPIGFIVAQPDGEFAYAARIGSNGTVIVPPAARVNASEFHPERILEVSFRSSSPAAHAAEVREHIRHSQLSPADAFALAENFSDRARRRASSYTTSSQEQRDASARGIFSSGLSAILATGTGTGTGIGVHALVTNAHANSAVAVPLTVAGLAVTAASLARLCGAASYARSQRQAAAYNERLAAHYNAVANDLAARAEV